MNRDPVYQSKSIPEQSVDHGKGKVVCNSTGNKSRFFCPRFDWWFEKYELNWVGSVKMNCILISFFCIYGSIQICGNASIYMDQPNESTPTHYKQALIVKGKHCKYKSKMYMESVGLYGLEP